MARRLPAPPTASTDRHRDTNRSRLGRMGALLGLLALLGAIFALHLLVLYPSGHLAVLYTLPVLLAAWLFRPGLSFGVALSAVALHGLQSSMDGTPLFNWVSEAGAIMLIAALAIWGAEQWRGQVRLAVENAALAEARLRETERMQALADEQEMLAAELAGSRGEMRQFLAMVTHEIAGSLTVLSGHAQMMASPKGQCAEVLERSISPILAQTQRLNRLVNDLRDLSSIERGMFDIHRSPCDLVMLTARVVGEQQGVSPGHRLKLDTTAEALPGGWDGVRLAQVVSNLVRNAVYYSPEGSEVRVSVGSDDRYARVSVADQGMGIAPSDLQRLFKPYSRLQQTANKGGTGLGLYISRAIAEAHGGNIRVRSEPGKGAIFTLSLPLGQEIRDVNRNDMCAASAR